MSTNQDTNHTQDRQVIDNIAVGLGTRPEWSGADELEWIAEEISKVRPHPGGADDYVADFEAATGRRAPSDYVAHD